MTTRTKAKASQKNGPIKNVSSTKFFDTRVFFLDGALLKEPQFDVEIISLRNPSTEKASKYLYAKHLSSKFFELLSFDEEPRSWFANDLIHSNGNLYMTSVFDPLFWGVYYIRLNNVDRAQPIEQTLIDDNFANTHLLADALTVEQLAMIADQKGDASLKAFKYNEEKVLKWLTIKCKKLAGVLKEKKFHIGAKSLNYVKSEKFDDIVQNDGELLAYAFGIVGEYITMELCEKLSNHLGLEKLKPVVAGKRKSLMDLEHKTLKRVKSEEDITLNDVKQVISPPPVKEKKVSTKEKQLAKAASGTKSISSFFSKK